MTEPLSGAPRAQRAAIFANFLALLLSACAAASALGATSASAAPASVPVATSPQTVRGLLARAGVGPSLLGGPRLSMSGSELARRSAGSRMAYAGLDRSRALALAHTTFPGVVARPAWRGIELRPGEKLVKYLSASSALIQTKSGRRGVVVGNVPLVGTTPAGSRSPVDLSLQDLGGGSFSPVSADVPLTLPATADQSLRLPAQGIAIQLDGAAASAGQPDAAQLAYTSVYRDTDAFVQSVPSGLELSYQLRSADAPHTLSLTMAMQAGDVLRLVGAHDLMGGLAGSAEIDRGGPLLSIAPAIATDAAGQSVPVSYAVESANTLTMSLRTGPSTVWPVMVDPTVGVSGVAATSGAGCNPNPLTVAWLYGGSGNFFGAEDSNCNLFLYGGRAGSSYNAYDYYEWAHLSQAYAAYIYRLDEYNASHNDYPWTTSTTFQGGLVAGNGQALPGYALLSYGTKITDLPLTYSQNPFTGQILTFCVGAYGAAGSCTPQAQNAPGATGDIGFFEMYANASGIEYAQPNVGMGAETLYSSDAVAPTLAVTASAPTSWVPAVTNGSISFTASDPGGLGIANATLSGPGITDSSGNSAGLTATNPCVPAYGGCTSGASNSYSATIHYNTTTATPDGTNTLTLTTTSVSGIVASTTIPLNIDHTPPVIALPTGNLYDSRGQLQVASAYQLHVSAHDGSSGSPSAQQSGVKAIDFWVAAEQPDGSYSAAQQPDAASHHFEQACPQGSCAATTDFTWSPPQAGRYRIDITVHDQTAITTQNTFYATAGPIAGVPGTPDPPDNVQAVAGNGSAQVSWLAPSGNGTSVDHYTVTPYSASTNNPTGQSDVVAATVTSDTVTGLTASAPYYFKVSAHNAQGDGGAGQSNTLNFDSSSDCQAGADGSMPSECPDVADSVGMSESALDQSTDDAWARAARTYHEKNCYAASPCGSFDGAAAASYAARWYNKRNDEYQFYGGNGGDCTNFASQALAAGGLSYMRHDQYGNVSPGQGSWWSQKYPDLPGLGGPGYTATWRVATSFVRSGVLLRHLLDYGLAHVLAPTDPVVPGDLVFYKLMGPSVDWDHTQVVTRVTSSAIWVAQHSVGYNKPLSQVLYDSAGHYRLRSDAVIEFVHVDHTVANI